MKAPAKVIVLVITSITLLAQQTKTAPKHAITGGMLSGRVFGVTNSGDVKPAILADVHLFYLGAIYSNGKAVDVNDQDDNAGLLFMNSLLEEEKPTVFKMKLDCWDMLMAYNNAVLATLEAMAKSKPWQIVIGRTDENGYFNLRVPRQGGYLLVVDGQAGTNEAVWEQDDIDVFAGKTTELKIGSPKESCLKTGDD